MPRRIALDTSFVVGLIDDKDIWSSRAIELEKALEGTDYRPVIFDCVLSEVISTLARRTQEKRRAALLPELLKKIRSQFPTKSLVWLYPDLPELYDEVVLLVEKSGGELNFNDALIAWSCQRRGIELLASFGTNRLGSPNAIGGPSPGLK